MYIYKTTCLVNGKIYIGQSWNSVSSSSDYFGSGLNIRKALAKYGKFNFKKEILFEHVANKALLNLLEAFLIHWYSSANPEVGYNILKGVYTNPMEIPEIVDKLRGVLNPNYGAKAFTVESRRRISIGKSKYLLANPDKNPMRNPVFCLLNTLVRTKQKSFIDTVKINILKKKIVTEVQGNTLISGSF